MSKLDLILFIIANTAWAIIAIAQAQIIKNQKEMESLNDNLINAQRKAIETYRKSISVKDEYIELLEKHWRNMLLFTAQFHNNKRRGRRKKKSRRELCLRLQSSINRLEFEATK